MDPQGPTVAIQGFGNAGSIAGRLMAEKGFTVVAVSDTGGGIYSTQRARHREGHRSQEEDRHGAGLPGTTAITNAELLEVPVDILIPAALENQITGENAQRSRPS